MSSVAGNSLPIGNNYILTGGVAGMRSLLVPAVLVLALAPGLAAASAEDANAHRQARSQTVSDPAGDEQAMLALPVGGPWNAALGCHDPSLDILAVTAAATRQALRVEVVHAAPVLAPQLSCGGLPVAVASQTYALGVAGQGDNFLFLSIDAAEACLYVLFENPVQTSDCIQAAHVEGASIHLELDLRGTVPVGDGTTRAYELNGTLAIHAFNHERAVARPGPGVPFVADALLRLDDSSDADVSLKLRP
ncbi:MAG: hypothetical protein QOI63_1927 [Thermoplasmata archaeon]|nr:hypothetical protein [Thermoplasmata archaeon]